MSLSNSLSIFFLSMERSMCLLSSSCYNSRMRFLSSLPRPPPIRLETIPLMRVFDTEFLIYDDSLLFSIRMVYNSSRILPNSFSRSSAVSTYKCASANSYSSATTRSLSRSFSSSKNSFSDLSISIFWEVYRSWFLYSCSLSPNFMPSCLRLCSSSLAYPRDSRRDAICA